MFEHLRGRTKIMVTGPQRAGTRICTKMISHDTGHKFIGEEEFRTDSLNHFIIQLGKPWPLVIHAPCLCVYAHVLVEQFPNLFVVLMRRPVDDIVASQERIGWEWEISELMRFGKVKGRAAELKYQYWDTFQRPCIFQDSIEVEYEDLADHPLWKPKEQRAHFEPRQTE